MIFPKKRQGQIALKIHDREILTLWFFDCPSPAKCLAVILREAMCFYRLYVYGSTVPFVLFKSIVRNLFCKTGHIGISMYFCHNGSGRYNWHALVAFYNGLLVPHHRGVQAAIKHNNTAFWIESIALRQCIQTSLYRNTSRI